MKNMVETTAGPNLAMKAIFAICAFILAIVLMPVGTASAASYSVPSDAQASGTANTCTWYITSASDPNTPGQLVIYPTDGVSGRMYSNTWATDVPWHDYCTNILSAYVAPGVEAPTNFRHAFNDCENVTTIDISNLDTSDCISFESLFSDCKSLTSIIGLESLDTSNVSDFSYLFNNCKSLPSVDLTQWDFSSAEDLDYMFDSCHSIESIALPAGVMENVTSAVQMFNHCESITSLDVSFLNNGKVKYLSSLFQGCHKLSDLRGYENIVTSQTMRMACIFSGCNSLTSLDLSNWDTQNADSFYGLFSNCRSLTSLDGLENWSTSNVTSMQATFNDVSSLKTIDGITNWDVSKVETFDMAFSQNDALVSLDLSGWNTSAGEIFNYMFGECVNLKVLDISGFNTEVASDLEGMFTMNRRLQQVTLGAKFSFTGNGSTSCTLPTPNPTYIPGATGNWQAVGSGTVAAPAGKVYAPEDVPSKVAETYVMEAVKEPVLAASSTWYSGTTAKSSIVTINIVDSYAPTGSEKESWDASDEQDGSVMAYVSSDGKTLTIAGNGSGYIKANADSKVVFDEFSSVTAINGLSIIDTSGALEMFGFFADNTSLKSVEGIENWNVSNCTTFAAFFSKCTSLTSVDLSRWDMSSAETIGDLFFNCVNLVDLKTPTKTAENLVDIYHAFESCEKLVSVDVSFMCSGKIENAGCVFQSCENLKTITGYETLVTSSTDDIRAIFNLCGDLEQLDLSQWVTDNVVTMSSSFGYTYSLQTIEGLENWNVGNVEDMSSTFKSCWVSDLSGIYGWNVSSVESFHATFSAASKLTSLDLSSWSTDSAEDMGSMFDFCIRLADLKLGPGFSTENVVDFSEFLVDCSSIKILDISMIDTSAAADMTDFFAGMEVLQQVSLGSKFSFTGDGSTSCVLPTPDPEYIPGATGNWQAVASGTATEPAGAVYAPADVPSKVDETYVMEVPKIPVLAASNTWYKSATDRNAYTAINVVDSYAPTGSEKESWDASAEQDGSVMAYVSSEGKTLTIAGNGSGYIKANKNSSFAFDGFSSAASINGTELLDTSETTRMDCMFSDCETLESLNLDSWDVSNVYMFNLFAQNCYSLTSFGSNNLSDWDTSAVEHFSNAFDNCKSLKALDVSGWDVSSCEVFNYMFSNCKSLQALDVSTWDLSSATKMACIFQNCESLTTLDFTDWNTPLLADASGFLWGCTFNSIDVSGLDLGACTDIANFFYNCKSLKAIEGINSWDTGSVKLAFDVFSNCKSLTELDLSNWITPNMTSCAGMFSGCESLKILDISGFDTSNAAVSSMFNKCYQLQQVTLGSGYTFNGNGSSRAVNLPTPDPAYIPGAIGKWQAVGAGTVAKPAGAVYDPIDVPSNVFETYVMPLTTISVDVPVKVTLAASADGTWCTPTATANKIVNHSYAPVSVVSAKANSANGFTMLTAANVASSTASNVFGGTITAGASTAQDLTAISTSDNAWTMAAETDADDSDLISLQLAGSIGNVEGAYFTEGAQLFDITYTFELAL